MTSNSTPRTARWTAVLTAAAAAFPLLVALPSTAQAAEAATCAGTGPVYAVDSAGKLLRHDMPTPLSGGTLASPGTIDTGWSGYGRVLAGQGARFYGIKSDGLYLSHRVGSTGTWDIHHKKISPNFGWLTRAEDRDQVTVDRGDRIWVLDNAGELRTYKYDSAGDSWSEDSGKVIDQGWQKYDLIVAADSGVIYGRSATDGHLYRSRYDFTSQRWIERHVVESLADWGQYSKGITSIGGDTLIGVTAAGAAHYYRFDENTGDYAVYKKTVGASGWAGFTNVTGAPDACRITANHTPASPSVPLESYTPAEVAQSATGSLEFAYTDNIGRLVHGRMADASDFNGVQWTTLSGNEAFTGRPTLSGHADGRVVITAQNTSGSVWQRNQTAKASADWAGWIDLAGAMAHHPVGAKTPDGLLVQFAVDANGKPWYRIQQRANVGFLGWMPLAGSGLGGTLRAVTVRDGIQLFATTASGTLTTARFADGALSAWSGLGAQNISGEPSLVVYPGYRIRVFANDGQGHVITAAQSAENGAYGAWETIDGLTADGAPSAVISPLTGLTEITARGTDGAVHNTGETAQGSGAWRAWQRPTTEVAATVPTAFTYTNSSGPTWAYTFRTADNQTRVYQVQQTFARAAADGEQPAPLFRGTALPRPADD
ncbi:tachylectin-related carbohydrate-binding protein [Streptomyces sp. NPDC002669]|uniref:tachylectin-related carbohydrate-binding protein n=1 Tax=Streptomyces sp. NPDC002669 TaxID=3364658 RepID=UPI0036C13051